MRIVALSTLRAFWLKHPDAKVPLRAWYTLASRANWKTPNQIKSAYRSTSFVGSSRVVFNIKGNDYRLVVLVRYDKGLMCVRFVGAHAQYDRTDVTTV